MFKLLKEVISEKRARQYAEEYISNDMIKSIASQMCEEYVDWILKRVRGTDKNVFEINITYAVTNEGVIFWYYGDYDYNVKYRDFGYSVIEDDYNYEKQRGIAMALMSFIVPYIDARKKYSHITNMYTNIITWDFCVQGKLKLKMDVGNKLKSL
jgi:hypothetical protein